jgi:hypothetical protein
MFFTPPEYHFCMPKYLKTTLTGQLMQQSAHPDPVPHDGIEVRGLVYFIRRSARPQQAQAGEKSGIPYGEKKYREP